MNPTTTRRPGGPTWTVVLFTALTLALPAVFAQDFDPSDRLRGEGLLPPAPSRTAPPAESVPVESLEKMPIAEIDVVGNVSISRAEVLAQVRIRPGEEFDAAAANEDARRIALLEGVEYAYYNTKVTDGQIRLTFVVVERNLIRSISIDGNRKISDSKLLSEAGLKLGDYLDIFRVRNAVSAMEDLYREKGFPFAQITLDESGLDQGRVVFNITESDRVKIKKIRFDGNQYLKNSQLMSAIKTRVRRFIFWPGYYNRQQVAEDVDRLIQAYQDRGFLDVQVGEQVSMNESRSAAIVTFAIEEGPQYITRDVTLTGSDLFEPETLREETKLETGEFFSRQKADFDTDKILAHFLAEGYINALVKYDYRVAEEHQVDVTFTIEPGPRFRIGYITITGNENTHDKVIRRLLDEEDFVPGNWYNADIARGTGTGYLEKEIRERVYTESALIQPTGEEEGIRNALVNIVEGQTGSIIFGAGVASDSGIIGQIIFDQRNFDIFAWPDKASDIFTGKAFRGAGQRLRIAFEPGTEQTRFSAVFTEPFLYDMPVAMSLGGSGFERERESYDERRLKAFVSLEKRYKNDWNRGASLRIENVAVEQVEFDAPQEIKDVDGNNLLFGIRLYIRKDTTDSRYLPTKGYNFDAGYEQVGGDATFGVLSATQRWYKTLYEDFSGLKTVLETKLHGAGIIGDAPPFEKFYAGGIGTLRGFEYRGVSTRGLSTAGRPRREDPIGSDWIFLANSEVSVPLGTETFSALFFIDNGIIDSGGIRSAVGTGIQILIPQWFGPVPMRFELATPLIKDDADETRVFSFSVGALF